MLDTCYVPITKVAAQESSKDTAYVDCVSTYHCQGGVPITKVAAQESSKDTAYVDCVSTDHGQGGCITKLKDTSLENTHSQGGILQLPYTANQEINDTYWYCKA